MIKTDRKAVRAMLRTEEGLVNRQSGGAGEGKLSKGASVSEISDGFF